MDDVAAPPPRLLVDAAERLRVLLTTCTDQLVCGQIDGAGSAAAPLAEAVATLEDASRAAETLDEADGEALKTILTPLSDAIARYLRVVTALRDTAKSLGADARREQVKRAGGGLYSAVGAAPTAGYSGRVLGKL